MKRIFLGILGLMLASAIFPADVDTDLRAWYNSYNTVYFQKELPEAGNFSPPDVIIDFHLHDPKKMGITVFGAADGYIHMGFNPDYIKSENTLKMVLLHEMCHVQMFVEEVHTLNDHGPEWQGCMHRLVNQGAFDNLW